MSYMQSLTSLILNPFLAIRNIQVENPVSILDQEEAKKFLMGKSQDKYNFFMKATELERIDRTYASTVDNVQELGESQEKIRGSLEQSLEHVEMLKKKWEQHQALDKLKDKEMELNVKYAWSLYNCADEDYQRVMEVRTVFFIRFNAVVRYHPRCRSLCMSNVVTVVASSTQKTCVFFLYRKWTSLKKK